MKCFIPTRATDRLRSHRLAQKYGWDYYMICDTWEQAKRLHDRFDIPTGRIRCISTPTGLGQCSVAWVRNYVEQNYATPGEWHIWMDDNVQAIQCLPSPHLHPERLDLESTLIIDGEPMSWRRAFEHEASICDIDILLTDTIAKAESLGTIYAGISDNSNILWRIRKWQYFGYVLTRFALYKNDGSSWYPDDFPTLMQEDLYKSIDVIARYGCVLINRYARSVKEWHEAGGIGPHELRLPNIRENNIELVRRYPELVGYRDGTPDKLRFKRRRVQ